MTSLALTTRRWKIYWVEIICVLVRQLCSRQLCVGPRLSVPVRVGILVHSSVERCWVMLCIWSGSPSWHQVKQQGGWLDQLNSARHGSQHPPPRRLTPHPPPRPAQPPTPTPTAPRTTPPTTPSATPSTHPHGAPYHPANRPLHGSQHPPPRHPAPPAQHPLHNPQHPPHGTTHHTLHHAQRSPQG